MWVKRVVSYLWHKRRKHIAIAAGAVLVGLSLMSVFWQLMYPPERALPTMRIGTIDVSHKDRAAIIAALSSYAQKSEVTITTPSKQWKAKWQSVGITIDAEASADAVLGYDTWERMIPFSSLIREARSSSSLLVAIADDDRLTAFAKQVVAEDKQASHDATIQVKDGVVFVDEAKHGYEFTVEAVKQQLKGARIGANTRISLVPERLPARPASELAEARTVAETLLRHSPVLKAGDKAIAPDAATIGSWLTFPQDDKTKKFGVSFNREAIMAYLATLDKQVGKEPGTATITTLDGQEISRTLAESGLSAATDANINALIAALQGTKADPMVPLAVVPAPPRLSYVRTYSQSDAGLLAIIQDWEASHRGDYAVIVRELGGQNRYAEDKPDKTYVTASTFKMFVYYTIQLKIKDGSIGYGTKTDMGWTVEACLTEMIVKSTNPCAISLMNLVGWQWAEDKVREAGFSNTYINNQGGGDKYSTIRDETNFMLRLYHGTLMSKEATDRLIGYFKRQVWRAGIPSGVPEGVEVADKVGLYDGWVHDVGIVYGPKSTYILGIMSKNGSDPAFADLSRRVYNFFQN
ncbi:MAG TPA: serine hydrolase [Candidatus Saccharimonadales bacterium]|nr:serine hydrolase [Candidatus Saccharimonadales bacterium]